MDKFMMYGLQPTLGRRCRFNPILSFIIKLYYLCAFKEAKGYDLLGGEKKVF